MKWRGTGVPVPALWLMAAAAFLAGCGGPAGTVTRPAAAGKATTVATGTAGTGNPGRAASGGQPTGRPAGPSPSIQPAAPSALPVAPGAGSRPQTRALPSTGSVAFRNAMADLWLAVTTGKAAFAGQAFFPEAAYVQVKAIIDPAADWRNRLWYDFTLDLAAVHRLVGEGARLVRVVVPVDYTVWVPPGSCYNSTGYWNVPGARVEYRQGGQLRSFGIASLISWRGVWYVVHLGAETRAAAVGEVDDPAVGLGVPGPPGGC
jgi:hypothetical protein